MESKTPREQRIARIEEIAKRHRIPMTEVLGDRRYRQVVRVRRAICVMLRNEGLTTPQIGQYINRDHTSVLNLLGRTKRSQSYKHKENARAKTSRKA